MNKDRDTSVTRLDISGHALHNSVLIVEVFIVIYIYIVLDISLMLPDLHLL